MTEILQAVGQNLGVMEGLQAEQAQRGLSTALTEALERVWEELADALDCLCPDCHGRGLVREPGTFGEGDDPADDVECRLCRGTGQIDPRWAKAIKIEMYCSDCGKWRPVAQEPKSHTPLCIHCWHRAVREVA